MPDASRPCPGTAADRARAISGQTLQLPQPAPGPGPGTHVRQDSGPAVILVGPPGAGKSSVGSAVARMAGLSLRDTDSDIEAGTGRSIPDIFLQDGETYFRTLERAAVATALVEHTGVLALGGGAVMAPETRALLAGRPVVFLNLSMSTGVRRTGLGAHRPLLAGVNPRATYKALLEARLAWYREVARHEVQTDQLSVAEVARIILDKMELL